MENRQQTITILVGKLLLSLLFFYAGILKLQDMAAFATSIRTFDLVPTALVPTTAATIPIFEIILAICLQWRRFEGAAAASITMLSLGFALFYAISWTRGIYPTCGCFGSHPMWNASPPQGVLRALCIATLAGCVWSKPLKEEESAS